ncbi:MAG: dgoT [Verrucomicrobiales bacterium]|nr:dgoT [Verrucomicrobiales bacterium]
MAADGWTENQKPGPGRTAWVIVALLMPVALLNYLDRQMLASMKTSVMAEIMDIGSEANWGRMLGQFKWAYALLSPVGGWLADRYSRRMTICASLLAWSTVTWWTGHVHSYGELLAARTLMGISEAFYIPAALALIADHHAGPTRSRAVSLHQMGIYCGVIVGGFSGHAADSPALGWRWAFDVCGIVGLLYVVPLMLKLRDVARSAASLADTGGKNPGPSEGPLRALLGNRSFLLLVACFTLPALSAWIVRDWMPAVLKTEFGIGQGKAGVSATLYWQLAAIAGAFGGGWLADRWMGKSARGRIRVSALGMMLIVPALFGVGYSPATGQLWVAVAFLILFGLGWGFFDTNNMPILCQIVRPRHRATGYGLMNLVSISAGGMADWGFGTLRDRQVPLMGIFSLFGGLSVISVILVLLIRPRVAETASVPDRS